MLVTDSEVDRSVKVGCEANDRGPEKNECSMKESEAFIYLVCQTMLI